MQNPMSLSANFAELRPDHLHSGVDFRTGGKEGEPVYAVARGYIARIVVRANGYGNALYVAHPNQTTSVYAHLQQFTPRVKEWVLAQHYAKQSFALDLALSPLDFPVEQGELLGYSGNSGRSFGPHLHFELRDNAERPTNVIRRGVYAIEDYLPPQANTLMVYAFDTIQGSAIAAKRKELPLRQHAGRLSLAVGDTVGVEGATFFGLDMRDRMSGSSNTFGVSSCAMRLNDSLIFAYDMDKFSFDETRYCNAMLDFTERQRSNRSIVRLYVAPNNRLSIYRSGLRQGVVSLPPGKVAKVGIVLTDDAGNQSQLTFWVRSKKTARQLPKTGRQKVVPYLTSSFHVHGGFHVSIPAGALYEPELFEAQDLGKFNGSVSPVFRVKQPATPPHRAVTISLEATVPQDLCEKAVVVHMDKSGHKEALATSPRPPYFTASCRKWGYFFVGIDTTPPQITPVDFACDERLSSGQRHLTLRVKDNLNELASYAGYVDNSWALFEYDEKSNLMRYAIDDSRVVTGRWHSISFFATDVAGNKGVFSCSAYF
ncbi:MAG: M23 family metallopeptidase [Prevotellaceae bacterium]|nr:M23 family metallopeptidase [Prevotellaceae bacterium]